MPKPSDTLSALAGIADGFNRGLDAIQKQKWHEESMAIQKEKLRISEIAAGNQSELQTLKAKSLIQNLDNKAKILEMQGKNMESKYKESQARIEKMGAEIHQKEAQHLLKTTQEKHSQVNRVLEDVKELRNQETKAFGAYAEADKELSEYVRNKMGPEIVEPQRTYVERLKIQQQAHEKARIRKQKYATLLASGEKNPLLRLNDFMDPGSALDRDLGAFLDDNPAAKRGLLKMLEVTGLTLEEALEQGQMPEDLQDAVIKELQNPHKSISNQRAVKTFEDYYRRKLEYQSLRKGKGEQKPVSDKKQTELEAMVEKMESKRPKAPFPDGVPLPSSPPPKPTRPAWK